MSNLDIRHHYIEGGEGYPLILIHGNSEDYTIFSHQFDFFAQMWHVYVPDTRGHGQTPRGSAPFTIRQFAEDLLCFMDDHGIEKADILGFSDGGNIAMIFAMKYPERVNQLILDGANLDGRGVERKLQFFIELEYGLMKCLSIFSKKAKAKAEMDGLMVNDPNIDPKDLQKIQAPTLVMAGTHDLILREHTELIAASIPNAMLAFVEGGHGICHENPEDFNRVVYEFLTMEK